MTDKCYIGIDGGGTQTRALLTDHTGKVRGCGHAGSANRNHYSRESVRRTLSALFQETLSSLPASGHLAAIFLGVGGISTQGDRQDLLQIVGEIPEISPSVQVIVENDTVVGLTGGLSGRPGLSLIAGTGSACLGINPHGDRRLCGGWGALADDIGSAPWIGLQALQAVVRAEDGRASPTRLQQIVFDFLGLSEPRELISRVHNYGLERAELGRLAPRVARASEEGDAVAQQILREAAAGLSEMVQVTAKKLFGDKGCELVLVGGLALSGAPFQPMLIERIQTDCPQVRVCDPEMSPVKGAVLEALRADGVAWTPDILANLKASIV